jgi:hypothetical protein
MGIAGRQHESNFTLAGISHAGRDRFFANVVKDTASYRLGRGVKLLESVEPM